MGAKRVVCAYTISRGVACLKLKVRICMLKRNIYKIVEPDETSQMRRLIICQDNTPLVMVNYKKTNMNGPSFI